MSRKEVCECEKEDWECDEGFYLEEEGACKRIEVEKENRDDCSLVPSGYRLVSGTRCAGGVQHKAEKIQCPDDLRENYQGFCYFIGFLGIFVMVLVINLIKKMKFVDKIGRSTDYDLIEEGGIAWNENMMENSEKDEENE